LITSCLSTCTILQRVQLVRQTTAVMRPPDASFRLPRRVKSALAKFRGGRTENAGPEKCRTWKVTDQITGRID